MTKRLFGKTQNYYLKEKVIIKFQLEILNTIMKYVIEDNKYITRGNLTNCKKLFDIIDDRAYEDDFDAQARVHFIRQALIARLDLFMENRVLILDYCRCHKYAEAYDDIVYDIEHTRLSPPDIKQISSMVTDKLNYSFMYLYKDYFANIFNKIETNDFIHLKDLKAKSMEVMNSFLTEVRRAEALEQSEGTFSLDDGVFESAVEKTVIDLQNPSNNLKCGMQDVNTMFGGAFESERLYLFLGISGGFKSGWLLNLLYQIKLNNMNYKTADPLKKPAILLYTQENTVAETINRLFSLAVSNDKDDRMKNYKPKEAIRLLRTTGKLVINTENNINIIIKYAKSKTKTTNDLYTVIDDLEDEGYEVICLIHDYVKRLRSSNPTGSKELRLELADIIDELKALAIEKKIPVITASQLNKEAAKIIDEGVQCNKSDLARMLGRTNVGESWAMIENADYSIIINREVQKSTGRRFLTFKLVKGRGEDPDISYFNHPFADNNTMRLIQDAGVEKVSIPSLGSDLMPDFEAIAAERVNAKKRKLLEKDDTECEETFDMNSFYHKVN